MKILILDSGVYTAHPAFRNGTIDGYGLVYDEQEDCCIRVADLEDQIGHGTAVYDLIRKNCTCADIRMVKIFEEALELSEEALVAALSYIQEHEKPDLLNLSLGITNCTNVAALYEVCRKIREQGTVILSAFSNDGAISYPAAFDCVYGVTGAANMTQVQDLGYVPDSYVNLCAKGTVSRLAWKEPNYVFLAGNSFSCAMATAALAARLHEGSIHLEKLPIGVEHMEVSGRLPFAIERAAIFPFNKEMHSLARFPQLLSFEIVDIFDHRYSGHVNASVRKMLNAENALDRTIRDISDIEWDKVDTLILGHIEELARLTKDPELGTRLIAAAREHGVKVYAFDPGEKEEGVFRMEITARNLPTNHYGKLFRISKPVLGIWGTSSRQGKFTLQLIIRELFQKAGYQVGQLGTEPTSLLFGMDEVFPYGYNSGIRLTEAEALLYINRLMNNICLSDCDIIIAGAQSAAVSYGIGNLEQFIPYQHAFLCGTAPDAIVLMVSPHDSVEYISNTIRYVEAVSEGKVIALCLFPKRIEASAAGFYENYKSLSEEKLKGHRQYLQEALGVNTWVLGREEDMKELVDTIIDYFG